MKWILLLALAFLTVTFPSSSLMAQENLSVPRTQPEQNTRSTPESLVIPTQSPHQQSEERTAEGATKEWKDYRPVYAPTPSNDGPAPIYAPVLTRPRPKRTRPTHLSTGAVPVNVEVGSDVEFLDKSDEFDDEVVLSQPWTFTLRAYMRAPMRIGFGHREDQTGGTQWHSRPRVPGNSSGDWTYTAIAPNPTANMYAVVGNRTVSANLAFGTNMYAEAGWKDIDANVMGVIYQAYLTLRYPNAFGRAGGLALMAGSFGNRYGLPGYSWRNSGHYSANLFGRTKVAGLTATATFDISNRAQLVIEEGIGGKFDQPPFIASDNIHPGGVKKADFVPSQGSVPYGSGFLHHSHVGVFYDEWLRAVVHFFDNYSPNDNAQLFHVRANPARMMTIGGEVKINHKTIGSLFLGYNHIKATNVTALKDQLGLLNSSDGKGFKANFFGKKDPYNYNFTPLNDSGTVEAILFEYQMHPGTLLPSSWLSPPDGNSKWPHLGLSGLHFSVYGMFNRVFSPNPDIYDVRQKDLKTNKLKWGVDFLQMLYKWLYLGARYDYVRPDLAITETRFQSISPRLVFRSNYKSKEYVVLAYTHYWNGIWANPSSPYSETKIADKDMVSLTAIMSF